MKKTISLILIGLAALCLPCTSEAKKRVKNTVAESAFQEDGDRMTDFYLNGIWAAQVENDPEKSARCFIAALAIDSTYAPAHYGLANLLPDKEAALRHSLAALEADPGNEAYLMQLRALYLENNRLDEALRTGEKLIRSGKNPQRNYMFQASLYLMNRDYGQALAVLDSLTAHYGESEEILDFKADIIGGLRPDETLLERVKGMARQNPLNPKYAVLLGTKYMQMRRDSLALNEFRRALELDADNIRALVSLFDFYNQRGQKDSVMTVIPQIMASPEIVPAAKISLFNDVLTKDEFYQRKYFLTLGDMAQELSRQYPDNFEAVKIHARQLVYQRQLDEALALYKDAAARGLGGADAYRYIIDLEFFNNRLDSVIAYSRRAYAAHPEESEALTHIQAQALLLNRQQDEAVALLKERAKGMKNDSIRSGFYTSIGDIYGLDKRNGEAMRYYAKALSADPENATALNNYAYLLAEEGKNLKKALAMAEKAVGKEPSNTSFLDTHGWILFRLGRLDEAQQVMSRAIALDTTNNAVLLLHYGDILHAQGKQLLAATYWKKALEAGADSDEIEKRFSNH